MIHGIKCTLNFHLDWVVIKLDMANVFNLVLRRIIFQNLHAACGDIIQFIPCFHAFYAFESPLFYSHHNHENEVTIIPSAMGTHQGGILGGALFVIVRFRALHSTTSHFPFCLFSFITNDTYIIGPPLIVSFAYEHFQNQLYKIGLIIKPKNCATWSPFGMLLNFDTPSLFNIPSKGIKVFGVPLGASSFISFFIKDVLLEDVWHVDIFLRMGDV